MKVRHIFFAVVCIVAHFFHPGLSGAAGPELWAPSLDQSLENIRKAGGSVGVLLISLPSGQTALEYNSKEAFSPASLVKVLTSYAALKKLGPSFRFKTEVYAHSEPAGGTIQGDIWIKGYGDPFFVPEKTQILARYLKDRGIREITGGILTDESFFEPAVEHICLDPDCIGAYNPVVSAAAIGFNMPVLRLQVPPKPGKAVTVDSLWGGDYARVVGNAVSAKKGGTLRVHSLGAIGNGREEFQVSGQAPVRGPRTREYGFHAADPAGLFAHSMKKALENSGIMVRGVTAREGAVPAGAVMIARYESPPLSELVASLIKHSNNFMAEMLLKGLAGQVSGAPGTTAKGVAVVRAALKEAQIQEQEGMINCGSGLSRFCRVSPETFSRVLVTAWQDPAIGADFLSSLAVNGAEGTLKRRMRKPGLTVKGKTGTLNDVIGFTGYVTGPSGKTWVATIMMNDVRDRGRARLAIDSFLENVAFSN